MRRTTCDELLLSLDAERLLPPLRAALELTGSACASVSADVALLSALRDEPRLRTALGQLLVGDGSVLQVVLSESFPDGLSPASVHRLSLGWLWCGPSTRRVAALRGLLWIWDRHPEVLLEAARRSVGEAGAEAALCDFARSLLAPEEAAIASLGAPVGDLEAGRGVWARLQALELWARLDGLSERALTALDEVRVRGRTRAVAGVLERSQASVRAADRRRADGVHAGLGDIFVDALALRGCVGDDETLSAWVLAQAVDLAWPLHHDHEGAAVLALLDPVRPFVDDLGRRLRAGEAFGHQATYADYLVMVAQSLPRPEGPGPPAPDSPVSEEALLEMRRVLLRQGLEVCPVHRNTRVCLAAADVSLAELRLGELERLGVLARLDRSRVSALVAAAEQALAEARSLRPERVDLAALESRLEQVRARWG